MDRVETITSWYKDCLDKIQAVHSIFIDIHGEDRVDLQRIPDEEEFVTCVARLGSRTVKSYSGMTGCHIYIDFNSVQDLSDTDWETVKTAVFNTAAMSIKAEIIVYYPEAIVENEDGQRHTIYEFYTKVIVDGNGLFHRGPFFNRTHYTAVEFEQNYMHSHVSNIPKSNFMEWQRGCLGSGPISQTIAHLTVTNAWDQWMLFAVQLDQYVHVESLQGIPYHHLSSLGRNSRRTQYKENAIIHCTLPLTSRFSFCDKFTRENFVEFAQYFCDNFRNSGLFIQYMGQHYVWGSSFIETVVTISNYFIEWFNNMKITGNIEATYQELLRYGILRQSIQRGETLVTEIDTSDRLRLDYSNYGGKYVCTFKGKRKLITIIEPEVNTDIVEDIPNSLKLLNTYMVQSIIDSILTTINLHYGGKHKDPPSTIFNGCQYQI